jgi:hypothetical protein
MAAIVLLFNVWGMNKPGMAVRVDWEKQMQDVHICMRFIRRTIGRYVIYLYVVRVCADEKYAHVWG